MLKWGLLLLFLFLIGCDKQKDVSFNIDDEVIVKGNNLNFKYKNLECSGLWILKDNENGLLTEKEIEINKKIIFKKGILKDLKCNKELKCENDKCFVGNYYINLDPEIGEIEKEITTPINYQTNKIDFGNGKFAQESYLGFENYKDGNEFKPINMTLIDYGNYWKTTESVYYPLIPKYSDEWFEFNNVFEENNHTIKIKPTANKVLGILNKTDNSVLYKDVFGEGIDLEIYSYNSHLLKQIVINKPQSNDLYFDFELSFDNKLNYNSVDTNDLKSPINLKSLELSSSLIEKSIEFNEGKSPTTIYPMKVWDSNNSFEYINYKIYQQDGKLYFRKVISKTFLEKAVYPVYTDDDTGAKSPGTITDDATVGTIAWTNPDNAKVSDNNYAVAGGAGGGGTVYSHYLNATNFGFTVPTGAKIDGILVGIEKKASFWDDNTYTKDTNVKIVKADGTVGATNYKNATSWITIEGISYYPLNGSSIDLWGEIWTAEDINDADFGVVLSTQITYLSGGVNGNVDHIHMIVYYTWPVWTSPTAVISYSSQTVAAPATEAIDGSTLGAEEWDENAYPYDVEGPDGDWYITVDMGQDYCMNGTQIWAQPFIYTTNNPCSVINLKVCDDTVCSGESDLMTTTCTFPNNNALQSNNCTFPDTSGRYVYIEGGITNGMGSCVGVLPYNNMVDLVEIYMDTSGSCEAPPSDTTNPAVNLSFPLDNAYNTTTNTIDFVYNVSDASTVDNCSLFINGKENITSTSITKDTPQNITTYIPNADYLWNVNCSDSSNNIGSSQVWNLSVAYSPPADTCSCPISGDWNMLGSDNCILTTNCNLQGNKFSCSGSGTFTIKADITNYNSYLFNNGCRYLCSGGCFK